MPNYPKPPDSGLPIWYKDGSINEALFCEEFLAENRIVFADGAFFTPDGRVTDLGTLRTQIYQRLKCCAANNIPKKISNILGVLELEAQTAEWKPCSDEIHLANGTLKLDGSFSAGKPKIVRNRLPVPYHPDAPSPSRWLCFLDELL